MAEAPSEMSSISLYAYNQLITIFIATFHEISIVEMHPLYNFGTPDRQLEDIPKL